MENKYEGIHSRIRARMAKELRGVDSCYHDTDLAFNDGVRKCLQIMDVEFAPLYLREEEGEKKP